MLVSIKRHLAYLAVPKTGSTAIEQALAPLCDLRFMRNPRVKHLDMRTFERFVLPYLEHVGVESVETVCVIREPLDRLASWYRYRSRDRLVGTPRSTRGKSFAEFIEASLEPTPPAFAKIGLMSRFVAGQEGTPAVTHMFRYENMAGLATFLRKRFPRRFRKAFEIQRTNVSPPLAELSLPPALRARLETERAADFALYADHAR